MRRAIFDVGAAMALLAMPSIPMIETHPERQPGRKTTYTAHKGVGSKTYAPNGKREVARRLRQIAAGQLKAENGLLTSSEAKG